MGLKLKWFRRRITFEGIPPAPERNIRMKEHNTGVPVAGVYRQSINFEDYIVSNSSSHWTPTPNQRKISPIRELDTSTSSSSVIANKLHVNDKITPSNRCIVTPPEPSYSPPKPPVRRAKSTSNLKATAIDTEQEAKRLEERESTNVSNSVAILATESLAPIAPAPRTTGIKYNQSHLPTETNTSDLWNNEQPELFSETSVRDLASTTALCDIDTPDERRSTSFDETVSFDDIFEKVRTKPKISTVETIPNESIQPLNSNQRGSIESIFEPRPEETPMLLIDPGTDTPPDTEATKPLPKSILKKRAPVPPQAQSIAAESVAAPKPPPRSIRREESKQTKKEEEDDDDYLNWNLVERHRSSISHTVAAKVNPEIVRNVPASLQAATRQVAPTAQPRGFLDEPPKTLRGMRNRRLNQQQQTSKNLTLEARDSLSNASEASA